MDARPHKYARIEEERRLLLSQLPPDLDTGASFIHITDRYFTGTRMGLRRMASAFGEMVTLKLTEKCYLPDQEARHTTMPIFISMKPSTSYSPRFPLLSYLSDTILILTGAFNTPLTCLRDA